MRFWHQLVEFLRFRDDQNCGEAIVWQYSLSHFWPRRSCMLPPKNVRYCLMQSTIMRPVVRRVTSPIPIGLTPGRLSRATSRQPLCAIKSSGGILEVASFLANVATSLHRIVEVCPKAEKIIRQSSASRPDGPALPWVFIACSRTSLALILLKTAG